MINRQRRGNREKKILEKEKDLKAQERRESGNRTRREGRDAEKQQLDREEA